MRWNKRERATPPQEEPIVQDWKRNFVERLDEARQGWVNQFDDVLDKQIGSVFQDLAGFVGNHGFKVSTPMQERGRRSFKFELAENAYVLLIFRSTGIGEFEVRLECFAPAAEPILEKSIERLSDADRAWAENRFQNALDLFIRKLSAAPGGRGGNLPADVNFEPDSVLDAEPLSI